MNGNLPHLVVLVEELHRSKGPDVTLDILIAVHGAREKFAYGAYQLRLCGVGGSSTMGGAALIKSWLRAARKKLEGNSK